VHEERESATDVIGPTPGITTLLGGLVSLGLVAVLAVPLASAKSQAAEQQATAKEGMRDRLKTAVESLNLTDDQKPKLKNIFADAKTQRQTVMNDASLSDDQKKAKMKDIHEVTKTKVNNILTPDQQIALKSKMEAAKANAPAQP
jgi:Spy/CpxP family protein refolding chaperone